ncbi:MAG: nucleotidyl transferase AbiEii/AbiGii toxin family protein [Betaproteobacteria bacterium]|nr:nucleotidyl transferase AbiEii/AbiGii toxin family protein [Betaproteobacteria bacterium]
MIATLVPKLTRLPPEQRRLWPELRPGVELGFVLHGGTAISLHLGHRASIDFDFFRTRPLDKDTIRKAFPFMPKVAVLQDAEDTLVVMAPVRGRNPVKVAFYGGLPFGRVGDPLLTRDGVLEVASLDDLMAHKLRVILARPEKKDYEDIAAMIRAGRPVSRGLAGARALFGKSFQPAAALKALVYFEGGDLAALSAADRSTLIAAARTVGVLPAVKLRSSSLSIPIGAGTPLA